MNPLYSTSIATGYGNKTISVYHCNILDFDEEIDILTTSAFVRSYEPTPRSLFGALYQVGISVQDIAQHPEIDLRSFCNVWLSRSIGAEGGMIGRIGCVELVSQAPGWGSVDEHEGSLLNSITAYFQMLDLASTYGIKMDTVALPILGAGDQNISIQLMLIPILNECVSFLKRNNAVKRICFIERSQNKAELIKQALQTSYMIAQENAASAQTEKQRKAQHALAFISHASEDKNIADNLCAKLEKEGVKVWYAPRDVRGPYAAAIAEAISKATHFVVILSQNSMSSEHILNEVDLAFQRLPDKIKFEPLRIDDSLFTPSFHYYLSRQHWMDAIVPPLEARLDEFVERFITDL